MQAGAEVNKKSFDGNTALHLACGRGNVGMVALLMAGGADPNIENDEVDTDSEDSDNADSGEETKTVEDADKDTDASEEKEAPATEGKDEVDSSAELEVTSRSTRGLRPEDYADGNEKVSGFYIISLYSCCKYG